MLGGGKSERTVSVTHCMTQATLAVGGNSSKASEKKRTAVRDETWGGMHMGQKEASLLLNDAPRGEEGLQARPNWGGQATDLFSEDTVRWWEHARKNSGVLKLLARRVSRARNGGKRLAQAEKSSERSK